MAGQLGREGPGAETPPPVLLAAPDKFRGTASAQQVSGAMAKGAGALGWSVCQMPLSDGGEGLLDVLAGRGGTLQTVVVTGPGGAPTEAAWLRMGGMAVVEMARASGLMLAGGAKKNDAVAATSRGTGELIVAAARNLSHQGRRSPPDPEAAIDLDSGGRGTPTIVVGLGGSATTDGGLGALEAIEEAGGLGGVQLVGACDVEVGFIDAARRFAPQKGADRAQVAALEVRLDELASRYQRQFGIDVRTVTGAGAAGGFGGAIVALGGTLRSGYQVVTELLGFDQVLRTSQVVVTGEGAFDATSLLGKVVGSVLADASESGVPALVIAGRVEQEASEVARAAGARVVSLSERFGEKRARADTERCIEESVAEHLGADGLTGP
jgi:glycerate 2-kinase